MRARRQTRNEKDSDPEDGVYGFLAIIRAMSWFAITFPEHAAALRVLAAVAQHLDTEYRCTISQDILAARLGLSRQAVNRQLKLLDSLDVLVHLGEPGRMCRYYLAVDHVQRQLAGSERANKRKAEKRAARKAARDREAGDNQHQNVAKIIAMPAQAKPEESQRASPTIESEMVAKPASTAPGYNIGDRVYHQKFGRGDVTLVDGTNLAITFDHAGEKRVVDSFVERA